MNHFVTEGSSLVDEYEEMLPSATAYTIDRIGRPYGFTNIRLNYMEPKTFNIGTWHSWFSNPRKAQEFFDNARDAFLRNQLSRARKNKWVNYDLEGVVTPNTVSFTIVKRKVKYLN